MDGLCTWLTKYHVPFECSGGANSYLTTEIHEDNSDFRIDGNRRTNDEFETWIAQLPSSSPTERLRMLWLPLVSNSKSTEKDQRLYPWHVDARKVDLDQVLTAFRLSLAYSYSFSAPQGYAILHEGISSGARSTSYCIFRRNAFIVAWAPTEHGDRTRSLIVCHADGSRALQGVVKHQKSLSSHPLFPGLVVAMWQGNYVGQFLITLTNNITQVENRTGYHPWTIAAYGTAEGDFISLSMQMSGVSTNLAELTATISFLRGMLKWLTASESKTSANPDFMACIEMIGARLDQQEIHLAFLQDRANNQLTVLFNLITSQDARAGIEVARDSKTLAVASKLDSSSMKTLAAVSVVFLPGTFVASFFAMPMFDIQHDSMGVSNKFWIYWIITVPLTIITVLMWYLWIRRKRIMMEEAERPLQRKDADEESGLKSD